MSLKPIVPGCMALTMNHNVKSNNGKIVKVIQFVGCPENMFLEGNNYWEIDTPLQAVWTISRQPAGKVRVCPEDRLMRIDGYEKDEYDVTVEKEKCLETHL